MSTGNYIYDDLKLDFEPIYVGKGSPSRPVGHKYSLYKKKSRFYDKYLKIIKETNEKPKFVIIKNNLSEDEANKLETLIISRIGKIDNGGTLTNITDGGDNNGGFKVDKSVIIKRIKTLKNSYQYLNKRLKLFIERSKLIHKNKYDYTLVEYKNAKTKVKIICKEHGTFEQTPDSHLSGRGCSQCGGNYKISENVFLEKSKLIHKNKYDYSLIIFTNQFSKVEIICPLHGIFKQLPVQHIKGQGCPKCKRKKNQ